MKHRLFLLLLTLAAAAAGWSAQQDGALLPGARTSASTALAAVDEILEKVSELSGLDIKHPVKSAMATREEIRTYIGQRIKETTSPAQLYAQQIALQKFGLLPKGFQLEKFVVELLAEQAAAYYDPRRKQFFLADWAPLDLQRTTIAHELLHALQDQHFDLDSFLQKKGMSQDEQLARAAVVEGQGVLAMTEFALGGRDSALDYPNLEDHYRQAAAAQFPVFAAAPPYMRESLLFPYTVGLNYVRTMARIHGKKVYAETLRNPPRSTHEVMHPGRPPLPYVEMAAPPVETAERPGYRKLDSNVLGEVDVLSLLRQVLPEGEAREVAEGWRGLKYDVYERQPGEVILAHRSVWKTPAAAVAFVDAYRQVVTKKGGEAETRHVIRGETVDFIEGVRSQQSPR